MQFTWIVWLFGLFLVVTGVKIVYFLLGGAIERFHLLRYGVAAVLVFVGLKMVVLDAWAGGRVPAGMSLAVIGGALAAAVVLSVRCPKR